VTAFPAHSGADRFPRRHADHAIAVNSTSLLADPEGALYWPEQGVLVVADLHLEKGSSFAARGVLLPPYDTAATLARLARRIAHYAPRVVVALGDSFHDGGGPARLGNEDRANLRALQRGRDWLWLTGNHDPDPANNIGGTFQRTLTVNALTFRHQPSGGDREQILLGPIERAGAIGEQRHAGEDNQIAHALRFLHRQRHCIASLINSSAASAKSESEASP